MKNRSVFIIFFTTLLLHLFLHGHYALADQVVSYPFLFPSSAKTDFTIRPTSVPQDEVFDTNLFRFCNDPTNFPGYCGQTGAGAWLVPASPSTVFYSKQLFNIGYGFETNFTLAYLGSSGQGAGGISLTFRKESLLSEEPTSDYAYGMIGLTSAVGVTFDWESNTNALRSSNKDIPPLSPSQSFRFVVGDKGVIDYTVTYDTMGTVPVISVYDDTNNAVVLVTSVDLAPYIFPNGRSKGTQTINAGFTSNTLLSTAILKWTFRSYSDNNVIVACHDVASYSVALNGVRVGSGNSVKYSADSYPATINARDIISFTATKSGTAPSCIVELHSRQIIIDTSGLWKCTTSAPGANWQTADFSDAAWPAAQVIGFNPFDSRLTTPVVRHVSNVVSDAERLWASGGTATTVYCRAKVPYFCKVQKDCPGNFLCDGDSNLCYCPAPWSGVECDQLGDPVARSIFPISGSSLANTVVRISGGNLSQSDNCQINGENLPSGNFKWISYDAVECTILPRPAGTAVQLKIVRGALSTRSFEFSFKTPPVLTDFTPRTSQTEAFATVTVTGANFVAPMYCQFGTSEYSVTASVTSSTQMTCVAPKHPPAKLTFSISNNNADWVSQSGDSSFIFFDYTSKYCREWRMNNTIPVEFDFVSLLSQQSGLDDSLPNRPLYLPTNLAFRTTKLTTPNNSPTYFDPSELTDEDFCCAIQGDNQGTQCGVIFKLTSSENPANIQIELEDNSYVNEIVTSWYDPCRNLPPSYTISYLNGSTWMTAVTRATEGNGTACFTMQGDNGPVGICVDYFKPVTSQQFKISMVADTTTMATNSRGASLFEVAIQGVSLSQPLALGLDSTSSWKPPSSVTLKSNEFVVFPPFRMRFLNILGNVISLKPAYATNTTLITAQLYRIDQGNRIAAPYLTGKLVEMIDGRDVDTFFKDMQLSAPMTGDYELVFTSSGASQLDPLTVHFKVNPGDPYKLKYVGASLVATSGIVTTIPSIQLCISDISENPTSSTGSITVQATFSGPDTFNGTLAGTKTKTLAPGVNCTFFDDLSFARPVSSDSYSLFFKTTSFSKDLTLPLKITEGPPYQMSFMSLLSSVYINEVVMEKQPKIQVTDLLGNLIGVYTNNYFVEVTFTPLNDTDDTARLVQGNRAYPAGGIAEFTSLGFQGKHGTSYRATFFFPGVANGPTLTADLYIQNCTEISLKTNTILSVDGYTCLCLSGYEPDNQTNSCTPCQNNYFKEIPSNSKCQPCDGPTETLDRGATTCVCKKGFYLEEGNCLPCVEGGVCKGGFIVGTQKGYWRPESLRNSNENSDENSMKKRGFGMFEMTMQQTNGSNVGENGGNIKFYPCYRGDSPSLKERAAAEEACPGNDNSITPGCGPGYSGIKCLECQDGFGSSGPFCNECPNNAVNWVIIILCIIFLIAFLVFLVYQSTQPRNKEAISARILMNHLQMLALLSAVGTAWNNPFQTLLLIGGLTTFINSRYISTECAFKIDYYAEFGFFLLVPLGVIILSLIVHTILYLILGLLRPLISKNEVSHKNLRRNLVYHFILSIAVILFVVYPAICIKVLEMFDCSIKVEGTSYLNAAPSKMCSEDSYKIGLGIAWFMLFGFCIILPVICFVLLWRYRDSKNEYVQMIVRFFYDGYKKKRYYWEVWICLRKFLIAVAIIVGREGGTVGQIYGFIVIVQAAILAHIIFHPYISGRQYRLELWSLLAMLVTLGVSLFMPSLQPDSTIAVVLSTIILILNIVVILAFLFFMVRGFARKMSWQLWTRFTMCRPSPKIAADFKSAMQFFETLARASQPDKNLFYKNVEKWWKQAPNYKKRRLLTSLTNVAEGSPLESFSKKENGEEFDHSTSSLADY